jgi:hypothetical protein
MPECLHKAIQEKCMENTSLLNLENHLKLRLTSDNQRLLVFKRIRDAEIKKMPFYHRVREEETETVLSVVAGQEGKGNIIGHTDEFAKL